VTRFFDCAKGAFPARTVRIAVLVAGAALTVQSSVTALEIRLPAAGLDRDRLASCAREAVRWSFLDQNVSDAIYVDGTGKFGHFRLDGYALHWNAPIWSFVSNQTDSGTGLASVVIGYQDSLNDGKQERNQAKADGMRRILMLCLARR
jgi:hypothetical protein